MLVTAGRDWGGGGKAGRAYGTMSCNPTSLVSGETVVMYLHADPPAHDRSNVCRASPHNHVWYDVCM